MNRSDFALNCPKGRLAAGNGQANLGKAGKYARKSGLSIVGFLELFSFREKFCTRVFQSAFVPCAVVRAEDIFLQGGRLLFVGKESFFRFSGRCLSPFFFTLHHASWENCEKSLAAECFSTVEKMVLRAEVQKFFKRLSAAAFPGRRMFKKKYVFRVHSGMTINNKKL